MEGALKRAKSQEDRVTDAYVNEAMDLVRYKAEMEKLRARKLEMGRSVKETERRKRTEEESRRAIENPDRFCQTVGQGLDNLTFEDRQQLLRLVVERITVDKGRVVIESGIPTGDDGVQLRARCPEALERRAHTAFRPHHVILSPSVRIEESGCGGRAHPTLAPTFAVPAQFTRKL